jgi:hypothetical protein
MNKISFGLLAFFWAQAGSGASLAVPAGGDLQGALNQATSGDVITLTAGATYTGHFTLPPNPGPACITIQSSNMGALPGPGIRAFDINSPAMPKLMTPDDSSVLTFSTGNNNYCIVGIEFLPAPGVYVNDLIRVGTAGETSIGDLPTNIVFDRDYIHGDPNVGGKRGIALNGGATTVENSFISDFKSTWQDTQTLAGWNGPGPYNIINNFLEAGTETVAFGGAVPSIPNVVPSDIVIQGNHFYKPLSWCAGSPSYAGVPIWVKNHIEFKNAQRVSIDSNVFENNWVGADQRGFAFMFAVRSENGDVPWAVVKNIGLTNNQITHSAAGIEVTGHDDNGMGSGGPFLIQNNLWTDISSQFGGDGRLFQILSGVQGVTINHNTAFQEGYLMTFDVAPSYGVIYTNNLTNVSWGVAGNGTGIGAASLAAWVIGGSFTNNALIGGSAQQYPAGNAFPSSLSAVGFLGTTMNNLLLLATSPLKALSNDGMDVGANDSQILRVNAAATSGVPAQ